VPINFDINTEQTGRGNHVMLRGKKYMLDMPLEEALEELNAAMADGPPIILHEGNRKPQ
jgi:hypothetical protein